MKHEVPVPEPLVTVLETKITFPFLNKTGHMLTVRMIIYRKDVERIIGKSDRTARKIMAAIRKKLGKEKHQPVSIKEFCRYMNLAEEEVLPYLRD